MKEYICYLKCFPKDIILFCYIFESIRYINFHQRKRFNMHRIYYAVEKAINHVEPASKEVNYLSANIDLVQGLVIGQIYTNCI